MTYDLMVFDNPRCTTPNDLGGIELIHVAFEKMNCTELINISFEDKDDKELINVTLEYMNYTESSTWITIPTMSSIAILLFLHF